MAAQLMDVGSGIVWVIRPLHILSFRKVSISIESMLFSAISYGKIIRGARRHVGDGGNGRGIYSD